MGLTPTDRRMKCRCEMGECSALLEARHGESFPSHGNQPRQATAITGGMHGLAATGGGRSAGSISPVDPAAATLGPGQTLRKRSGRGRVFLLVNDAESICQSLEMIAQEPRYGFSPTPFIRSRCPTVVAWRPRRFLDLPEQSRLHCGPRLPHVAVRNVARTTVEYGVDRKMAEDVLHACILHAPRRRADHPPVLLAVGRLSPDAARGRVCHQRLPTDRNTSARYLGSGNPQPAEPIQSDVPHTTGDQPRQRLQGPRRKIGGRDDRCPGEEPESNQARRPREKYRHPLSLHGGNG